MKLKILQIGRSTHVLLCYCTKTKTVICWVDIIFSRIRPQTKSELPDILPLNSSQVWIAWASPALCLVLWSDKAGCSGGSSQCITSLEKIEKVCALFGIVKGIPSKIHCWIRDIRNALLRSNNSWKRRWATSACSSTSRSCILKFGTRNPVKLCGRGPCHRCLRLPCVLCITYSFETHLWLLRIAHTTASTLSMISTPELPSHLHILWSKRLWWYHSVSIMCPQHSVYIIFSGRNINSILSSSKVIFVCILWKCWTVSDKIRKAKSN